MSEFVKAYYSTPGRGGHSVIGVVPHIAESSSMAGVDATFTGGVREASAHYCVDGANVHQYVDEADTAWAVGNWTGNCQTISIEHVGTTANPPGKATLDRSARLMAEIAQRHGWTSYALGTNVFLHKWFSATSCPATLDVDYLISKANDILGGSPEEEEVRPMEFVYRPNGQNYLNWFDGSRIHTLTAEDELNAVAQAHKASTGKDIPMFELGSEGAPWATRFADAVNAGESKDGIGSFR